MATLLTQMNGERVRRREVARVAAYRRLREALGKLLPPGSEVWVFGSLLERGVDVLSLNETGLRSKIQRVGERWTL
jgi:hypothetical protein